MSHNGESTKQRAKRRKLEKLALRAALKKNSTAGVKILMNDNNRSSQSHRSEYTRNNIKKATNNKETNKKGKMKKNMKGRKKLLPSEDSCDEGYRDNSYEDYKNSDEDYENDYNNDGDSTENSSDDNDGNSSEDEESIPTSNKRAKHKSNQFASEDEESGREQDSPYGSSEENQSTKESHKTQIPRGSTNPPVVLDSSLKKSVIFNKEGQPIGENSIAYSSEVGAIARDMVPLTYDDWRSVDMEKKEIYWKTILTKFVVDEELGKSYTLQSIGKLWRAHKSRLRIKIRDYNKKGEDIKTLKPSSSSDAEWAYFVRKLSNKAFKKKSKKFRDMRKKQNLPHTCSRRGYARLAKKMKKESPNPSSITRTDIWMGGHTKRNGEPSNENVAEKMRMIREIRESAPIDPSQETISNDPVAQVLGADCNGRVRGGGHGVTASKLKVVSQHNAIMTQLQTQVTSLTEKQDELIVLLKSQAALIKSQAEAIQTLMANNQVHSSTSLETNVVNSIASPSNPPIVTRPAVSTEHVSVPNDSIAAGDRQVSKCKLMNWANPNEEVAIGRFDTSDPSTLVHCKPLGENASRVWVDEIIKPSTLLWRNTSDDDQKTLAHVINTPITWPTKCIKFIEAN